MAKFILMFQDTIDGGIDASFDIVNHAEGAPDTDAIKSGKKLIQEIKDAWSYKAEVTTNERKKSKVVKKRSKKITKES